MNNFVRPRPKFPKKAVITGGMPNGGKHLTFAHVGLMLRTDTFARFMRDLNMVYQYSSAFWEQDFDEKGFEWIDCHQEEKCVYAIERRSKKQKIAAIFNFSDTVQEYELKVPKAKEAMVLLASDADIYSGSTHYEYQQKYKFQKEKLVLELPPFSAIYLELK